MKIIVPLAGPDFDLPDGTVKATCLVDGIPLLRRALESRPWWGEHAGAEDLTFILRDTSVSRRFSEQSLDAWFPGSERVFVSCAAQGAAFSTLAGLSLRAHIDEIICVDLADILFDAVGGALEPFASSKVGGAVLTFPSQQEVFSYLRRNDSGEVVEAAEKRVISDEASAGVYFFRSPAIYLRAAAHALENRESQTWKSLFFVCPLVNGVLAQSLRVVGIPVASVRAIKI